VASATSEAMINARPSGKRTNMCGTVYGRPASGARLRSLARGSPRLLVIDDSAEPVFARGRRGQGQGCSMTPKVASQCCWPSMIAML
jgi:hypothetical protein